MSSAGQYIYTVIIAAIFAAVLQTILPGNGPPSSVIRLAVGVFLIGIIISPLLKVRFDGILEYVSYIETDASAIITEVQKSTAEEIRKVILQQTEAYILDKAATLGANISVEITFKTDASSIPDKIKIIGPISPLAKKQLSAVIKNDLGISEEMQTWVLA